LAPDRRRPLERRLEHDFANVRIHDDPLASASAAELGAAAYAVGRHVVLGAPLGDDARTDAVLAHELAHVAQAGGDIDRHAVESRTLELGAAGGPTEAEAGAVAAGGASHPISRRTGAARVVRRLPFGIRLPTNIRALTAGEITTATAVYGTSIDFTQVHVTDALGGGGRPFTLYTPPFGTVINAGPTFFSTPGSSPAILIHELAHSWQSQHHPNPAEYMSNSLGSQAAAAAAGGDAYCFVPGKPFGRYAAEQIANQVEKGVPGIVSHVAGVAPGAFDLDNVLSLSLPRWETRGAPGVVC
jgi:hypothetical protein